MQKQMTLTDLVRKVKESTRSSGEELVLAVVESSEFSFRWELEDVEFAVALVEGGRGW